MDRPTPGRSRPDRPPAGKERGTMSFQVTVGTIPDLPPAKFHGHINRRVRRATATGDRRSRRRRPLVVDQPTGDRHCGSCDGRSAPDTVRWPRSSTIAFRDDGKDRIDGAGGLRRPVTWERLEPSRTVPRAEVDSLGRRSTARLSPEDDRALGQEALRARTGSDRRHERSV